MAKYTKYKYKPCHRPTEVWKNLVLSKADDIGTMIMYHKVDVIVTFVTLPQHIWDLKFKGELIYVPFDDYDVLPHHILKRFATIVIKHMKAGRKVGVCCQGGHGRTGYFGAAIIGKLNPKMKDPIEFLWSKYCNNAVETVKQVKGIEKFIGHKVRKNTVREVKRTEVDFSYSGGGWSSWGRPVDDEPESTVTTGTYKPVTMAELKAMEEDAKKQEELEHPYADQLELEIPEDETPYTAVVNKLIDDAQIAIDNQKQGEWLDKNYGEAIESINKELEE